MRRFLELKLAIYLPINELHQGQYGIDETTVTLVSHAHNGNLVTISSSDGPVATGANQTLLNGFAIVPSLQIGSGMFSAPPQVNNRIPSLLTYMHLGNKDLVFAAASKRHFFQLFGQIYTKIAPQEKLITIVIHYNVLCQRV